MKFTRRIVYYISSIFDLFINIENWPILIYIFLGGSKLGEYIIKFRNQKIKFYVRGAMDVWSVKETFINEFYTLYGVPIISGWTIVDIGAGIGDFSIYVSEQQPETIIYAFEPFPSSYDLLNRNLLLNGINNVISSKEAVWFCDTELVLDFSKGEPLQVGSLERKNAKDFHNTVPVKAISLKSLINKQNIKSINLLKLDCEGAEYDILMKAPSEILLKVERIIMEYHDLDSDHHHSQLEKFLKSEGFWVRLFKNYVHDHIGYLYAERIILAD